MNQVHALARLLLLLVAAAATAADLTVEVRDAAGAPVDDAVAYAVPRDRAVPAPMREATMDQYDRTFVPRVLPVQTGTAVRFPNSDDIRHHVYSFSPAKRFQIPLYEGSPADPVIFDNPGVLTLGCNIHDWMQAFIVVVDTPHFGTTSGGRVTLTDLEPGSYRVHVRHPRSRRESRPRDVELAAADHRELEFTLRGR